MTDHAVIRDRRLVSYGCGAYVCMYACVHVSVHVCTRMHVYVVGMHYLV